MRYHAEGVPLVVLAGKEYGSGSSRDWAAKGTALLGVRAVIAESYERIHRSNLIGMGVLPLQFLDGESASSLGLTGQETFAIAGLEAPAATGFPREVDRHRRRQAPSAPGSASTPPPRSPTTATAASCSTSSANSAASEYRRRRQIGTSPNCPPSCRGIWAHG